MIFLVINLQSKSGSCQLALPHRRCFLICFAHIYVFSSCIFFFVFYLCVKQDRFLFACLVGMVLVHGEAASWLLFSSYFRSVLTILQKFLIIPNQNALLQNKFFDNISLRLGAYVRKADTDTACLISYVSNT